MSFFVCFHDQLVSQCGLTNDCKGVRKWSTTAHSYLRKERPAVSRSSVDFCQIPLYFNGRECWDSIVDNPSEELSDLILCLLF